jgi:putative ABC transport system substrate-binding protein
VIGYLASRTSQASEQQMAVVLRGLAEAGFAERRDVRVEYRSADGRYERLPALAADLVRLKVAAIYAPGIPAVRAAKAATTSIPIVFSFGEDPVAEGIVPSLNRPNGNITGFSHFTNQLIGKRLALLCEIVPKAAVLGYLVDARNPVSDTDTRLAQAAARALGRQLEVLPVGDASELEAAFAVMAQRRVGAVAPDPAPFFTDVRDRVLALAASHALPAIYAERSFAAAGGLASYGADQLDSARQAGVYLGRILRGEKPGDLPVQQSTKLEFVINLKTAKSIGLDIPPTVVALADEVIE